MASGNAPSTYGNAKKVPARRGGPAVLPNSCCQSQIETRVPILQTPVYRKDAHNGQMVADVRAVPEKAESVFP